MNSLLLKGELQMLVAADALESIKHDQSVIQSLRVQGITSTNHPIIEEREAERTPVSRWLSREVSHAALRGLEVQLLDPTTRIDRRILAQELWDSLHDQLVSSLDSPVDD